MAYSDKNDPRNKAAKRRWHEANRDKWKKSNQEKREKLTAIVNEAKDVPCADCGVKYPPYVMDFDHIDPTIKEMGIANLVGYGNESRLQEEIAKCEAVCANCHRERTHGTHADVV